MKIEFSYLLKSSEVPIVKEINPEDYFNNCESGRFKANLLGPTFLKEELLAWTEIKITGCAPNETLIRTEYSTDGSYTMTYRKDPSGFEEIVCKTDISNNTQHVISLNKKPDQEIWETGINSLIANNKFPEE